MQLDWEIWLDANISSIIAKWLKEYTGWNVKSSYILKHDKLSDLEVFQKAKSEGKIIIISKDADFPELISRLGAPPKLINVRIGNCDNRILWNFLKPNIEQAVKLLTTTDIDIIELE